VNRRKALSSLAVVLGVFAACNLSRADGTTEPSATQPSLLSNGDFTQLNDDYPADWPKGENAAWHADGGTKFIRLTSPAPGKTVLLYRRLKLPQPLPPALELRIKVQYDVNPGKTKWHDARVMMKFTDDKGEELKPAPPVPSFHGKSDDWVTKSTFMAVPKGAAFLDVMPALLQSDSGTFDLAAVEIFPASEDQAPKPPPMIPSQPFVPADASKYPPELHVDGNELKTKDGKFVQLQGLCLDSLEWSGGGEHLQQSIPVAIDQWHANAIRLPMKNNFWWGVGPYQKKGEGGLKYRQIIDECVEATASRGAYLVLDLHRFGVMDEDDIVFWKDAALRYKDNPAVIFELFNEPHDLSWKAWRYGGLINDGSHQDKGAVESNEKVTTKTTVGMQALVDAIRSTGAKNLIIAGGLDWGFDLSGVVNGYALQDVEGADGIMYSSHIYPWKKGWQHATLDAAAKYPVFIGEVGNINAWSDFKFIPKEQQIADIGPTSQWPIDMLGMIQKYKLNWTGFSFHPKCGPMVISDWDYTPTPYWGVFVKDALAGKQFELQKLR